MVYQDVGLGIWAVLVFYVGVGSANFVVRGDLWSLMFPRCVTFCTSPWVCSFGLVVAVVGCVHTGNILVPLLVEEVDFLCQRPGSSSKVVPAEDNEPLISARRRVSVDKDVEDGDESEDYQGHIVRDLVGCELVGDPGVIVLVVSVVQVIVVVAVGAWGCPVVCVCS